MLSYKPTSLTRLHSRCKLCLGSKLVCNTLQRHPAPTIFQNGVAAPPSPCKHILTHSIACGRWLRRSQYQQGCGASCCWAKQGTATTVVASTGFTTHSNALILMIELDSSTVRAPNCSKPPSPNNKIMQTWPKLWKHNMLCPLLPQSSKMKILLLMEIGIGTTTPILHFHVS